MPRRRKPSRAFSTRLTDHQKQILLHGLDVLDCGPLVEVDRMTDTDLAILGAQQETHDWVSFPGGEKAAWSMHRDKLMIDPELQPCYRPVAFWTHDVPDAPKDFIDRVRWLKDRNLVGEEELSRGDRQNPLYRADQSDAFCSIYDDIDRIQQANPRPDSLRFLAKDFEQAAEWHRFRGRDELADRYERRAANCRAAEVK